MPTPGDALELPPGYGFSAIPKAQWDTAEPEALIDRLLVWEKPRKTERYVISVDVAGGSGLDRSVIEVVRVGNLTEPDEEVAQFVSDSINAVQLAYFADPIGRYYCDGEGQEALMAVENNGMGETTQSELLHHLGYTNHYIWQHEEARDARGRYSRAFGWWTNFRTRAKMLARLYNAVTTVDERSGFPDFRINSPFTMQELRDFQAMPGEPLYTAHARDGCHDDAIMAAAIAVQVVQTLHFEGREPIAEQRRRLAEEGARKAQQAENLARRVDYISSDCTADEMMDRDEAGPEEYAPPRIEW